MQNNIKKKCSILLNLESECSEMKRKTDQQREQSSRQRARQIDCMGVYKYKHVSTHVRTCGRAGVCVCVSVCACMPTSIYMGGTGLKFKV